MATVSVVLNPEAIKAEITGRNGGVARDLLRRANRVQSKARALCPVDKGKLRASITTEIRGSGPSLEARVGTNVEYAIWVHEGTGIYAGRGYIYPRHGRFLVWQRNGQTVFARRVRGVRGRPFLKDALSAFN